MELSMNSGDSIRLKNYHTGFIDCTSECHEMVLGVSFLKGYIYMEIRQKGGQVKTFYFRKKSHKKDCDLGYWQDAEVIFSFNFVKH